MSDTNPWEERLKKSQQWSGTGTLKCKCGTDFQYDVITGQNVTRTLDEGGSVKMVPQCPKCERESVP